jgi:GR25 family glycosyltransferase involved in LPS biosynthesis
MIFLINLDSAVERRSLMTQQLEAFDLPFERVGIDMRRRAASEITAWVDAHFPGFSFDQDSLSGAEVGCWLSHLSAWQRSLAIASARACTVIEDDVVLDAEFARAVETMDGQAVYDVVYFGSSSRNLSTRRRSRLGSFWAHEPVGTVYNTWGYSITHACVERLFRNVPTTIDIPIDHFLGGASKRSGARIAVLRPPVLGEHPTLGVESQIGPHTKSIVRSRMVERARRRLLASRVSEIYYSLYRFL